MNPLADDLVELLPFYDCKKVVVDGLFASIK